MSGPGQILEGKGEEKVVEFVKKGEGCTGQPSSKNYEKPGLSRGSGGVEIGEGKGE